MHLPTQYDMTIFIMIIFCTPSSYQSCFILSALIRYINRWHLVTFRWYLFCHKNSLTPLHSSWFTPKWRTGSNTLVLKRSTDTSPMAGRCTKGQWSSSGRTMLTKTSLWPSQSLRKHRKRFVQLTTKITCNRQVLGSLVSCSAGESLEICIFFVLAEWLRLYDFPSFTVWTCSGDL